MDGEVRRSDEHTKSDLTELSESQEHRCWCVVSNAARTLHRETLFGTTQDSTIYRQIILVRRDIWVEHAWIRTEEST